MGWYVYLQTGRFCKRWIVEWIMGGVVQYIEEGRLYTKTHVKEFMVW